MPGSSGRRRPPTTPQRREIRSSRLPAGGLDSGADRLAHTLAHLGNLHFASLSVASGSRAPDPLRPNSKIAIMPGGEYCTYHPPGEPGDHIFTQGIQCHRAPPCGHAGSEGVAARLPYALYAPLLDSSKMSDVAYNVFGGYALTISGHSVTRKVLPNVSRGALDESSTGLVDNVMRLVRRHEAFLCLGTVPDAAPGDVAHATPPAGRPALLRGPTGIYCERDWLDIRHYCLAGASPYGV